MPSPSAVARSRQPDPRVRDTLALAASYAEQRLVVPTRDTHLAVSGRCFKLVNRATGRIAEVPRAVHDQVWRGVYGSVGLALQATATGLSRRGSTYRVRPASGSRYPAPTLRVDGRDVAPTRDCLAAAYTRATRRVVVFVHGRHEDERHWRSDAYRMGGTYGSRLEAAAGWTPVYLRLDTSAPDAVTGVALTAVLQRLVDHWPVPLDRLALVGHGTGGLVVRAACAVTTGSDDPWTGRLTDVVALGAPPAGRDRSGAPDLPGLPYLPRVRFRQVVAGAAPEAASRSANAPRRRSLAGRLLHRLSGATRRGGAPGQEPVPSVFPGADVLGLPVPAGTCLLNRQDVYAALREWLG